MKKGFKVAKNKLEEIRTLGNITKESLEHQWNLLREEIIQNHLGLGLQNALEFIDSFIDIKGDEYDRFTEVREWEKENHDWLVRDYKDYLKDQTLDWHDSYITTIEGYWQWVDMELLKEQVPF